MVSHIGRSLVSMGTQHEFEREASASFLAQASELASPLPALPGGKVQQFSVPRAARSALTGL